VWNVICYKSRRIRTTESWGFKVKEA
jgi:hypothetical protein